MVTTTTVSGFTTTKNRIMGRLSQCTDPVSLIEQLQREIADLQGRPVLQYPQRDMDALVGIDRGIQAANDCIDGNTEKIDSL